MSARVRFLATIYSSLAAGGLACAGQVARKESKMAADIWNIADDKLSSAQAKFTYLGEQEKPIPTIVFSVEGHSVSMVRFLGVQQSKRPYTNDEFPYTKTFAVTFQELRRFLEAAKPIITGIARQKPDFLSFTVVAGAGDAMVGQEFFVPRSHGKQLLHALQASISSSNTAAHAILTAQLKNLYP